MTAHTRHPEGPCPEYLAGHEALPGKGPREIRADMGIAEPGPGPRCQHLADYSTNWDDERHCCRICGWGLGL